MKRFVTLMIVFAMHMRKKMSKEFRAMRVENAVINAAIENSLTGVRVTKAYVAKDYEEKKFAAVTDDYVAVRRRALHAMAQERKIMVVALSQFSRASEARDGEPSLTDLRESGQIEQDADAVLALYKNEADSAPADERVLQVLKNKEGRLGKVYLDFDGSVQQFAEYMDGQREVIVQTKKMEKKNEAKKSNPKAAV